MSLVRRFRHTYGGATGGFGGTTPRTPIFHNETILDGVLVGLADPALKMIQTAIGNLHWEKHRFRITAEGLELMN